MRSPNFHNREDERKRHYRPFTRPRGVLHDSSQGTKARTKRDPIYNLPRRTPSPTMGHGRPVPPGPPPLHSLHQKLSLPPVNPSPCSILIGNHHSPKTTLFPPPPAAAKLVADDSLHPHHSLDHRKNRPSLADPSPPSGARQEPPNADDDRRSPRLCSARGRRGEGTGQT